MFRINPNIMVHFSSVYYFTNCTKTRHIRLLYLDYKKIVSPHRLACNYMIDMHKVRLERAEVRGTAAGTMGLVLWPIPESKGKEKFGSAANDSDPQKMDIKAIDFQCGW